MNILIIGDIVGRPGRQAVEALYPRIKEEYGIDFFIANGENAAAGSGITAKIADELFSLGVDVLTMGDHVWDQKEIYNYMQGHENLLRPLNYPRNVPGKGSVITASKNGYKVGVVNVVGQVFMKSIDSPFNVIKEEIACLSKETPIIIVDVHAEATSEKNAMAWYIDGTVSALVGTHTHIQTADEQILPKGMAFITDLGMTGPYRSVLGRDIESVLKRFTTQMPVRFGVASEDVKLCGVVVTVDELSGKATNIERIAISMNNDG